MQASLSAKKLNFYFCTAILCLGFLALTACGGNTGNTVTPASSVASPGTGSASSASSVSSQSSSSVTPEVCVSAGPAPVAAGFAVENGKLVDGNGQVFVPRGINYPYAWYRDQRDTAQQFMAIRSTCANSVRIVLANGGQWPRVGGAEVSQLIDWAKAAGLVAILEVHDSTGWAENASAAHPRTAVDYWLSEDIREAVEGQEGYVLINIANEPLGNDKTNEWISFHREAIGDLRAAGLRHTLVVDAPNWGQDWSNTMRDGEGAQTLFDADPEANVVFSVHMYDVYGEAGRVNQYFQAFADKNLPLMVGEFAADHGRDAQGQVNEVAEAAIMAGAESYGFGYLGWSWSGNTSDGGLDSLDIVQDFDVARPSDWGARLIDGANGLRATSRPCSCMASD